MSDEPRDKPAEDRRSVAFECDLPEPLEKVWRALTTPEIVSEWLLPTDLDPRAGAEFTFRAPDAEPIECEVISIEHQRSIRFGWRDQEARRDGLDSTVTFEVAATETGGTHLRIVHEVRYAVRLSQPVMTACAGGMPAANDNFSQLRLAA
jgi:uncharacterized protein YndB with AHSA1/START domain